MAGEQCTLQFVWQQNIMVTQYQARAMSFILTWLNFMTLTSDWVNPSKREGMEGVSRGLAGLLRGIS